MRFLTSLLIWTAGIIITASAFLASLLIKIMPLPISNRAKLVHAQCFWWSDAVIGLNPYWKLEISGLNNVDKKRTYIIIANHQSLADIVLAYQTKMQFKWVAKESLFKIPFLGWSMALAKHIKLQRESLGSIKKVYRESGHWLRNGVSILFFPGERTKR